MRTISISLSLLAAVVGSAVAQAAEPAPQCAAPQVPEGNLAPWAAPKSVVSADRAGGLGAARLRVGQAADVALHPIAHVRLPVPAGREGGNGGLAEIAIARAGTYRFALGAAAWIDVVAHGKALQSAAHGHGPACTGIRKIVDFKLEPGRHTIVISGSPDMRARLLVVAAR